MSHPTLGLPPIDYRAGFPEAAARLSAAAPRLAARALEDAMQADPTFRDRYDDEGLRHLLRDLGGLVERLARSVASRNPSLLSDWAEWVGPLYRRRHVPMDDLIALAESTRRAVRTVLAPDEQESADAAIDQAIAVLRWHRRLAGDARKRNRLLAFIYKGA